MKSIYKTVMALACSGLFLAAADLSSSDQTFAKKAAQGGMAEVQLGQLATSKASDQKVKSFGQRMVDDHSKANDELKAIAAKENITLPTDMDAKDKALMARLSKLSGKEFDKAYMSAMLKDHETDVSEFQKEADSGRNSDLKQFASKTLPTLKEHLSLAKEVASAVGATSAE